MSNIPGEVILHPACQHDLDTVAAIEAATGRRAVIGPGRKFVRLVPVLRSVPTRQSQEATA